MFKKLSKHPFANAKVEILDNGQRIYLHSYKTVVATLIGGWLTINGLYSATTRKHISAFMQEYCHSTYQVAKHLYEEGLTFNIDTHEYRQIK